jgi:hypothetical protein
VKFGTKVKPFIDQYSKYCTKFSKHSLFFGLFTATAFLSIIWAGNAWSSHNTGVIQFHFAKMLPSKYKNRTHISERKTKHICYAGDREDNRPLNCSFSYEVLGLTQPVTAIENNGGHTHDYETRPLLYPTNSNLIYTGVDYDDDGLRVQSITDYRMVDDAIPVKYQMPETAGNISTVSTIEFPPNWYCLTDCYTENSILSLTYIDIGSDETLMVLPQNSEYWVRCTYFHSCVSDTPNDAESHPRMFHGRRELLSAITRISALYRDKMASNSNSVLGEKLRIGDIGLPRGGLFDIQKDSNPDPDAIDHAPWTPPHSSHRKGENADISTWALRDDNIWIRTHQRTFDLIVRNLRSVNRRREITREECPRLQNSAYPCIHLELVQ